MNNRKVFTRLKRECLKTVQEGSWLDLKLKLELKRETASGSDLY
jgi:hypothetical protein